MKNSIRACRVALAFTGFLFSSLGIFGQESRGTISGSVELTATQVADLEKRRLYVQVHSEKAPDGNLWGWLFPARQDR